MVRATAGTRGACGAEAAFALRVVTAAISVAGAAAPSAVGERRQQRRKWRSSETGCCVVVGAFSAFSAFAGTRSRARRVRT